MNTPTTNTHRHSHFEDVQGLMTGILFVGLGLMFFQAAHLVTGGVVGLSFLLHYATGHAFAPIFFVINLPFYVLAWKKLGPSFTIKTIIAVSLLSLFNIVAPQWVTLGTTHPYFAAVAGGLLVGTGLLILFRHRASMGGINVLVMWCQERFGWRAGVVQMFIDAVILVASFFYINTEQLLLSLIATAALNFSIAVNHRPGRYMAF